MHKCYNCLDYIKDSDKFCRNCGCKIRKNSYYVFINILMFFLIIIIIIVILLFLASYLVY